MPETPASPDALETPHLPKTAKSRALIAAGVAIGIAVCAVAFFALKRTLSTLTWADVQSALSSMPAARLGIATALVAVSYVWLSNYDRIGLWASEKVAKQRRIVATSFIAYAVSKTFGFPAFTSGLVRLHRYRHIGFTVADLARFVVITSSTVWLGFALLMGALLMVAPTSLLPLDDITQRVLGTGLVAVGVAWVALASKGLGVVHVKKWHFKMPTARVAAAQLVVGSVDWILMSSVLWMLLPASAGATLQEVALAVGAAQIVAVLAHVPGGAGVVEATLLMLFKDRVDTASLAASLVAFRVLYFLAPLELAAVFVAVERLLSFLPWSPRLSRSPSL
jgi:uncharacterized membrane protein YbhN (UPF0104 family)